MRESALKGSALHTTTSAEIDSPLASVTPFTAPPLTSTVATAARVRICAPAALAAVANREVPAPIPPLTIIHVTPLPCIRIILWFRQFFPGQWVSYPPSSPDKDAVTASAT